MALLGIILVAVLFLLQLTVSSGMINGLIFYVNIVSINSVAFELEKIFIPLEVFVHWLNLDFGIETCFHARLNSATVHCLAVRLPSLPLTSCTVYSLFSVSTQ